jgi:hypothetical protein
MWRQRSLSAPTRREKEVGSEGGKRASLRLYSQDGIQPAGKRERL